MTRKGAHPVRIALLIFPYGAAFGIPSQAIARLATQAGIPAASFGEIISLIFLVHTVKILWAPLVDTTLSRPVWYVIGNLLTALGMVASMATPFTVAGLDFLTVVILLSQVGVTLLGMSVEGLMAQGFPDDQKGRVAGWYNASNFLAIGSGAGIMFKLNAWLPERWMAGAVFAALMVPCCLALIGLEVPKDETRPTLGDALWKLLLDIKGLATSRFGATGLLIALVPVGAGAVQNLFPATADKWGIDKDFHLAYIGNAEDIIGFFNGFVGAALSAAGAMVGGWLADKMPRRLAYALAGFVMALTGIAMALAPRDPWDWIVFANIYNFFTGLAYAVFTSFVLETIGRDSPATKYNIFAVCANLAISYTTHFDTMALERSGTTAMLLTDAGLTLAGCTLLVVVFLVLRKPRSRAA